MVMHGVLTPEFFNVKDPNLNIIQVLGSIFMTVLTLMTLLIMYNYTMVFS
jgi:hypothetical protein